MSGSLRSASSAGSRRTPSAGRTQVRSPRRRRRPGSVPAARVSPYRRMLARMNATATELRPPSVHRVPKARLVDRLDALREVVRGRRVVDLGFVDEGQMGPKRGRGTWLHEVIAAAAETIVGIDADGNGVERARALGF